MKNTNMTDTKKQEITDKAIEYSGKYYSLRKILDSEKSWQKYVNGSDNFKKAVEVGVIIQLWQVESLFKKLDQRIKNL